MHEEDDLVKRLQVWKLDPPPADLASRIAREASRQPQRRPVWRRAEASLARLLTEWRYGLALKVGALAVCALVGIALGQLGGTGVEPEIDVLALAFGQDDWGRWL